MIPFSNFARINFRERSEAFLLNQRYVLFSLLICTIGFFICIYAFYPGIVNYNNSGDSITEYLHAVTGYYDDHYPPIIVVIWKIIDCIIPGAGGLFIFQLLLEWIAIAIISISLSKKYGFAGLIFPTIGFFPPVLNYTPYILKDVLMANIFLLVSSLLLMFKLNNSKPSKYVIIFICFMVFMGVCVRHNAITTLFAFTFWIAYLISKNNFEYKNVFYNALIISFILIFANYCFNSTMVNNRKTYFEQYFYLYDLVAISSITGHMEIPSVCLNPRFKINVKDLNIGRDAKDKLVFNLDLLVGHNTEQNNLPLIWAGTKRENIEVLRRKWMHVIITHPITYLNERAAIFFDLLKTGVPPNYSEKVDAFSLDRRSEQFNLLIKYFPEYNEKIHSNFMFKLLEAFVRNSFSSIILKPWFFLCLSWILLIVYSFFVYFKKYLEFSIPCFFICISILMYALPYFFYLPVVYGYRYLYWSILATVVLLMLNGIIITHYLASFLFRFLHAKKEKHFESSIGFTSRAIK